MMTQAKRDKLTSALLATQEPADLAHYAAHAAALELVENWRAALEDGAKIEQLLPDVDDTIAALEQFKRLCTAELREPT